MESPRLARRKAAAVALAVASIATASYGGTLRHGFALDDVYEVVRNEDVRAVADIPRLFARGAWDGAGERNPIYRPLTSATYALNHAVGGLAPAGYHLVNVVLHAAVSVVVLSLGLAAGLPLAPAALGALFFAVHPVHVEVVANVAGRKDALAAAFVVLAVLAHRAALRRAGIAWAVLPPLAALGALFSKESGAAVLPAIAAWDLFLGRDAVRARRRRAIALYATYAAALGLYLWARSEAVGAVAAVAATTVFVENPLAHVGVAQRLLTAVAVVGKGLGLLVVPAALSPDYSWNAIPVVTSAADGRFVAAAVVTTALLVTAARLWRSRPLYAFCAALYGAALLPGANLVFPVGTIFGERLLYLPSVAFCVAMGALANDLAWRRALAGRAVFAGALVAAAVLASRTVGYAAAWADEASLFAEAARAQPASAKVHQLLGAAFMEEGRLADGVRELEIAAAALAACPGPTDDGVRIQLGVAYERAGRLGDARGLYEDVLRRSPDTPDALWRLGVVRWLEGDRGAAEGLWRRTLAVSPGHVRAMADLGLALEARGDLAGAEALWVRAAEVDPRSAGPWLSLGGLYERRGELDRARAAWRRFLEVARYGVYPGQRELVAERLRALDAAASARARR
jgi:Flp pilus assembly protein TadD